MKKETKQNYNNSNEILENNTKNRNIRFYVQRTRTLQKANFIIMLITCVLCFMSSYVLISKQKESSLYLTGNDGRIFEYKNDVESAQRIRKVRELSKNEK